MSLVFIHREPDGSITVLKPCSTTRLGRAQGQAIQMSTDLGQTIEVIDENEIITSIAAPGSTAAINDNRRLCQRLADADQRVERLQDALTRRRL